jgi:hypothetical protein
MLALGTIEGRPATLNDSPDPASTSALFPLAAVDLEARREIAKFAVGSRIVAKRRTTGLDRLGDDVANGNDKPLDARSRQPPGTASRMDPGAMQRFARVDIAQTGDEALVEQKRLDRRGSAAQFRVKASAVEPCRLWAKLGYRPPIVQRICWNEIDRTEAARVVEREPPPLVRLEQQVIVLLHCFGIHSPLPRHAQVEHQSVAATRVDQSELAAPSEAADGCPGQPLTKVFGKCPAQIGAASLDSVDSATKQHLLKAADGCFDFGKLGHIGDMAKLVAAS